MSFNLHDVISSVLMHRGFPLSLPPPRPPVLPAFLWSLLTRSKGHRMARLSIREIERSSKLQQPPVFPYPGRCFNSTRAAILHKEIGSYSKMTGNRGLWRYSPESQPPESTEKKQGRTIKCSWASTVPFHCLPIKHKCSFHRASDSIPCEYVKTGGPLQGFMGCPVFSTYLQWFR